MIDKPRVEPSVSEPARKNDIAGRGVKVDFGFVLRCITCNCASAENPANKVCSFDCACHWSANGEPVIAPQPTSGQRCQNCDATYVNTNYAYCPACGSVMAYAIERNQ